ncbi:hypothetical protein D3C77_602570 [compost metagenome]
MLEQLLAHHQAIAGHRRAAAHRQRPAVPGANLKRQPLPWRMHLWIGEQLIAGMGQSAVGRVQACADDTYLRTLRLIEQGLDPGRGDHLAAL